MRKLALVFLLVSGALAPQTLHAQAATGGPVIRYHFGDNPVWAAPNFNDSSWPIADQSWPIPPLHSDGVVWVRMHIPVPPAWEGRLGLMVDRARTQHGSEQIFAQGVLVGELGQDHGQPTAVFELPAALASPRSATIAIRLWYPPYWRIAGGRDTLGVRLGSALLLESEKRARHLADVLGWLPYLSLHAALALVGIGLLGLWYRSRRRELLWFSLLLISYPLQNLTREPGFWAVFLPRPAFSSFLVRFPIMASAMFVTVEFLAAALNLRARWLRVLLHVSWVLYCSSVMVGLAATSVSPLVVCLPYILFISVSVFNLGTFFVDVRSLILGPNRAIAFGMAIIPLGSAAGKLGLGAGNLLGIPHLDLFTLGFLLAGFGIAVVLTQRAITTWRQGDRLRSEFATAREIQQRLVPADLPAIPGCRIAAAYLPAAEVGGDFYQVYPQADGSCFIIVGDVSGKGLRAAMTGTLVLGALRALAQEDLPPSQILYRVNNQLATASDGGFVTAVGARIGLDGTLTVANAGHLPPYRNGEELTLDNGLPLGIVPDASYSESTVNLAPGDQITFLSDGVLEAQNPQGELFGFDRTRQISAQSAEQIARAAQTHGQTDDITVLTVTFTPIEVLLA